MRLELIKKYIDTLKTSTREEVLEYLQDDILLSGVEKNAVYLWLFPFLLRDRELPNKIQIERGSMHPSGFDQPEDQEIVILLGAYRSAQYGGFIKHLLHAFTDSDKIFPLKGQFTEECCICGKHILHHEVWTGEKSNLAYGSKDSSVGLCINCIIQLQGLHQVLQVLEGSDYLNRYKR